MSTDEHVTIPDQIGAASPPQGATAEPPVMFIAPPREWGFPDLRELWAYRELLYFLVWRDVQVRYKQTALGVAWAVLQPLLAMIVFSLFFGRLARMPSDGIPYPIFALAALVPWTFFSSGLTLSANSLVADRQLITKVYFPRLAIPLAAVLSSFVDFLVAFALLLGVMLYLGIAPTLTALWIVPLVMLVFVTATGAGLWLAALNVQYRDVRYTVPFLTQIWLFATPIVYPSSLLPEPWRTAYGINPMAGVVEGFRWALLGTNTAPGPIIAVSTLAALLLLIGGLFYFRRMENSFADVI